MGKRTDGHGEGKRSEAGGGKTLQSSVDRQGGTCRGEGILGKSLFFFVLLL